MKLNILNKNKKMNFVNQILVNLLTQINSLLTLLKKKKCKITSNLDNMLIFIL